ncbi:MAG: calcium-binding protein, partial [Rhizobiaceae bacterium]
RLDNPGGNTGAAAAGDTYFSIEGLVGGDGNDLVIGDASANFLFGLDGTDVIYGLGDDDYLNGGNGTNQLYGGAGADVHIGGSGVDYARYDDANYGNLTIRLDTPSANVGAAAVGDTYTNIDGLIGGLGNDIVIGNSANNLLYGGGGIDYINGQAGNDFLNGGAGADRFAFSTALNAATNADTVADFVHAIDDLALTQSIFASIGATLDATELRLGTVAADANDFIIYNSANGQLFYDANGSGAGGQTLFATVTAGTVLNIGDFVMV